MSFYFVDQITELNATSIVGKKFFSSQQCWRYQADGNWCVIPGVIAEGIGQLVSWLTIKNNNFIFRPLFLFARAIEVHGQVPVNTTVQMRANIVQEDHRAFVFNGCAQVSGQTVVNIEHCGGYFWPLEKLENPDIVRQRYDLLIKPQIESQAKQPELPFTFLSPLGLNMEYYQGIYQFIYAFDERQDFYTDHFPRSAITPIVIVNELIGRLTDQILGKRLKKIIQPISIKNLKIKSFILPNAKIKIQIKILKDENNYLETHGQIFLDEKGILQGQYLYKTGEYVAHEL